MTPMQRLVLLSGRLCTGKSGLAKALSDEFGYRVLRTSKMLKDEATRRGCSHDSFTLRKLCDQLDAESNHGWIFNEVIKQSAHWHGDEAIVIDSIGTKEQLYQFRRDHRFEVVHAHLYAPRAT